MNQLEVFAEQRRVMRGFWQVDGVRGKREAEAGSKRQTDSRAVEQQASASRDSAAQTLQYARAMHDLAQGETRKINLSLALEGRAQPPLAALRAGSPSAELQGTAEVAGVTMNQLREAVAALLQWRADEEEAAWQRVEMRREMRRRLANWGIGLGFAALMFLGIWIDSTYGVIYGWAVLLYVLVGSVALLWLDRKRS